MSIQLDGLNKRFADFAAVDDVSLEILDGELFVLLGPSGSGKSTVLRIIAGLIQPDAGRVRLHGRDVTRLPPQARNVGMVFQNYSLFRHMTVGENIEFGLEVRRVARPARRARRDELLELIDMAGLGDRYPAQLSGGQMQRVAVARALAFDPSVLLLDEPFGALDVRIRSQLRRSLKRIQRHMAVTTVLVTHDQDEAFELADRIGVIDHGRLLEVGSPEQLYRRPRTEFVARFLGNAVLLNGRLDAGVVRLGALELGRAGGLDEEGDSDSGVAVMLRPEDLAVASRREALDAPTMGPALVRAVEFRGALARLEVDLEPPPGVRSLDADFGAAAIPIEVVMLPSELERDPVRAGARAWLGVRAYHVLPRTVRQVQLCVHEAFQQRALAGVLRRMGEMENLALRVLGLGDTAERASEQLERARAAAPPGRRWDFEARVGADWLDESLRDLPRGNVDLVVTQAEAPDVADRLARLAPIPVLILKGARASMERALLCTAAGEPGKLDVVVGARLVRRLRARATLLHVVRASGEPAAASDLVLRHLEMGANTLRGQGIDCDTKVRHGDVVSEILAEATAGEYDLIVVGGHLAGGRRGEAERDLAALVAAAADRSVLVVRGPLP